GRENDPVSYPDVVATERSGQGIETGSENDGLQFEMLGGRTDASLGELNEGRLAQVEQAHVGPVERLVVAGVQAGTFGPERERARRQSLGHLRVCHNGADLGPDELRSGLVGRRVEEDVDVGAGYRHQVTFLPARLV